MTFSYGRKGPDSKLLIQGVDGGYVLKWFLVCLVRMQLTL